MAILVLYNSNFDSEPFDELKANLDSRNIRCDVQRLEIGGPFAGIEAYLPTAIMIWVMAEFFRPILKGLGTDTYEALKIGLINIYKKQGKTKTIVYGSAGKIDRDFPYSMTMSLQSNTNDGQKIKLLIQKDLPEDKFGEVVDVFFNFLENYHAGTLEVKLAQALDDTRSIGSMKLVAVDLEHMKLIFPDPVAEQKAKSQ